MVLTMVGTGMLWVGWYGFNAGSAVAADGIAANAFMTTTLAAAVAGAVWPLLEWITRGKPTVLGFCSGIVAGLVVITPGRRLRHAPAARCIIGVLAGVVPFLACTKLKPIFKYDDALDTFGVHGVGGTLGALLTGFLATPDANANLATNLKDLVGNGLWLEQVKAIGAHHRLVGGGHGGHRLHRQGGAGSAAGSRDRGERSGSGRPRRGRVPLRGAGRVSAQRQPAGQPPIDPLGGSSVEGVRLFRG